MRLQKIYWIGFLFLATSVQAMDAFEYQVYDAEINKIGEYSLETHLNSNLTGKTTPDYLGKIPDNHLTHLTFEFARGMTPYWELGLYLQSAMEDTGKAHYAGVKLRSKFVGPHDESPFSWGMNFEISDVPSGFEQDRWGSEIRPILGCKISDWFILFNPIIDFDITPGTSTEPDFSPALKAQYNTHKGYGLGFEYYSDFNEINQWLPPNKAEQYLFAAYDLLGSGFELNLAVGAGLSSASNNFIAKGIFGFNF